VPACTYPLTGIGSVDRVYTDVATFDLTSHGVVVRETFGITMNELVERLDVQLEPPDHASAT
jgi:3-oxoadipate CoA-transferase beta subunit